MWNGNTWKFRKLYVQTQFSNCPYSIFIFASSLSQFQWCQQERIQSTKEIAKMQLYAVLYGIISQVPKTHIVCGFCLKLVASWSVIVSQLQYQRNCDSSAGCGEDKTCLQGISLKSWVTAGLPATVIWAWSSSRILDL